MTECPRCGGEGWLTVTGISVDPRTGFPRRDPQADDEAPCPDCDGTGEQDD